MATSANEKQRRRPAGVSIKGWTLIVVGALFGAAAFAAAGGFVGWRLATQQTGDVVSESPSVIEVEVPIYGAEVGTVMPDIRGLDLKAAREVLADVGVPSELVAVTERQAAGAVGVVIQQSPAFGSSELSLIELVVSSQALVPPAEGVTLTDLVGSLGELGAEVERVQRYQAGAAAGQVLSIEPASGSPLPATVRVTVAEASGSIFLSAVDRVEGSGSSQDVNLNGRPYDAVVLSAGAEAAETTWLVNRVVDGFSATVGIPDTDDAAARVLVEVLADGTPVAQVEAAYGTTVPLEATVTGALRLTVRVTRLDADVDGRVRGVDVALGDAKLTGSISGIEGLDQ